MISNDYKSLYNSLRGYIECLTNHSLFYSLENNRSQISEAVLEVLGLFRFLAKASDSRISDAENLIVNFKQQYAIETSEKHSVSDYSSKTIEELRDEVNYLRVCVNNICDIDLDKPEVIQDIESKTQTAHHFRQQPDSVAVFHNVFSEDIKLTNENLGQELGELLIKSHARELLKRDINNGSVYIYKTKPGVNVILKYVLLAIVAIGMCCSVTSFVMGLFGSEQDTIISLLALFFSLIFVWLGMGVQRSLQNENFKYSWQKKGFTLRSFIVTLTMIISILWRFKDAPNSPTGSIKVVFIISLASMFLYVLLYFLSYVCLQPPKNDDLIASIINKYSSDISSQGVSFK